MVKIPKIVLNRFGQSISKFQKVLQTAKDRDVNEADTVVIVSDILCEVLGYDKYIEVTSEFAIRGTYCDIAIKINNKVQYLIEVKAIGLNLKENHLRQAVQYAVNQGVQWIMLTNGIFWEVYKIRFEKPINFDLVCSINFMELNARDKETQDRLFIICREGLIKAAREEYFEKIQSVNKYTIGALLQSETMIKILKRELKKMSPGVNLQNDDITEVLISETLKREVVQGEEAENAKKEVMKFYRKLSRMKSKKAKTGLEKDPSSMNTMEDLSK